MKEDSGSSEDEDEEGSFNDGEVKEEASPEPSHMEEDKPSPGEPEDTFIFKYKDKVDQDKFPAGNVKEMKGEDFTLQFVQKHGLSYPLLFDVSKDLSMLLPPRYLTMKNFRHLIGSGEIVDVVEEDTGSRIEMTMKDWQRYYDTPNKDKILQLIPLEVSLHKLGLYLEAPYVVRQLDWVERVWPRYLKEIQSDRVGALDEMWYPKVQKYYVSAVGGSFQQFHIDMGGCAKWYHLSKGKQIFWFIIPTQENLKLYEDWLKNEKMREGGFFGDDVERSTCTMVSVDAGRTLIIPEGWIYAVYTKRDAIAYEGLFLHSYGINMHIRIAMMENRLKLPVGMRYPCFTKMLWYALDRYVHCMMGTTHLNHPEKAQNDRKRPHHDLLLTRWEICGIRAIILYLFHLATHEKCVPERLDDPQGLVQDVVVLLSKHRSDDQANGELILRWHEEEIKKFEDESPPILGIKKPASNGAIVKRFNRNPFPLGMKRRRRVRCRKCSTCKMEDCGNCTHCADMVKNGGPGKLKQTCVNRQCSQPSLPASAVCHHCFKDGWNRTKSSAQMDKGPPPKGPTSLMECTICYEVLHKPCAIKKYGNADGVINHELPNSWDCPGCQSGGKGVSKSEELDCDSEKEESNGHAHTSDDSEG